MKSFVRFLCFASFGICTFYSFLEPTNPYRLGFGLLFGLIFGWLFKLFLNGFLGLFNPKIKKEHGKAVIKNATDTSMGFMLPFVFMLLIATFYLNWSHTSAFISAGIMAVGTASAIELGKVIGKSTIKITIVTSAVCLLFSFAWIISTVFLLKVPPLIEGSAGIIKTLLSKGGV